MKRLLFHFDTDAHPSVFDCVVGYDGGADHVQGYGGVTPENVGQLVDGTIFTRPLKDKHNTAIFVSGGDMSAGEQVLDAIKKRFFADFRGSVMLDSNGSNTTAAAAVAQITQRSTVKGKRAVVLGGTGPVGLRAALMLAREGAEVLMSSRSWNRSNQACAHLRERYGVDVKPFEANGDDERGALIEAAQIVVAAGAIGVQMLGEKHWRDNSNLEFLSDCNAQPPLGIAGIDMVDKGTQRHGKTVFGAIGVGSLKLTLHRRCIARLFEASNQVLDAEEIYALAKTMA
jgi:hypothetical protein